MDANEKRQGLRAFPPVPTNARFLLLYLGRRGAMSRFTFEAMRAALSLPDLQAGVCISKQNENFSSYSDFGPALIGVDTFSGHAGALLSAWRIPLIGRRLAAEIAQRRVTAVIDLMPHVWSSLLARSVRKAGARYLAIAHDAEAHPGDATALVKGITDLAFGQADTVIALSASVAKGLRATHKVDEQRLVSLFHPILSYRPPRPPRPRRADQPLRLLFFGRIMPYKGLPLFVDMLEILRGRGCSVEAGVFGEGDLGPEAARLAALGAEVENHWLSDEEIASALDRYDLVVVSHVEASQSGVIAAAFGAGLPIVTTPVGGLPEQVRHNVDGLVATETSAQALASAVERIALEIGLYDVLCAGVGKQLNDRSMQRFVGELARLVSD
ncbi:glycosyltransferase family 4 protein [Bosea sp. LjRoot237]|uniref:glycosyltransferase family 4 protein n=1 Tax=Bosea sp. LjRoot237 TaxID=3342292 RepID=UPI003ECF42A2